MIFLMTPENRLLHHQRIRYRIVYYSPLLGTVLFFNVFIWWVPCGRFKFYFVDSRNEMNTPNSESDVQSFDVHISTIGSSINIQVRSASGEKFFITILLLLLVLLFKRNTSGGLTKTSVFISGMKTTM